MVYCARSGALGNEEREIRGKGDFEYDCTVNVAWLQYTQWKYFEWAMAWTLKIRQQVRRVGADFLKNSMIVGLCFKSTANAEVQMMVIKVHAVTVER
jgi:hypothetical protein